MVVCSRGHPMKHFFFGWKSPSRLGRVLGASLLCISLSACTQQGPAEVKGFTPQHLAQGTDLWAYADFPNSEEATKLLFSFDQTHTVRRLYFESGSYLAETGEGQLNLQRASPLIRFILAAKGQGIEVVPTFGNHTWAYQDPKNPEKQNHHLAVKKARLVGLLLGQLEAGTVKRVQFDVEPHVLPEWKAGGASRDALVTQYLDLLEKLQGALGPDLQLDAVTAYWYNNYGFTWRGETRLLSQWIIDQADSTTMMNYRKGTSLLYSGARDELEYAAASGKQVVVGVNVKCSSDPEYQVTTYCVQGVKTQNIQGFDAAVSDLHTQVQNNPLASKGWGGSAIFSYEWYRKFLGLDPH